MGDVFFGESMSLKTVFDFFDEDMLQLFEFERVIIDHVSPGDRDTL
jgi:hypothetical protein